jgi:hypothetical protein
MSCTRTHERGRRFEVQPGAIVRIRLVSLIACNSEAEQSQRRKYRHSFPHATAAFKIPLTPYVLLLEAKPDRLRRVDREDSRSLSFFRLQGRLDQRHGRLPGRRSRLRAVAHVEATAVGVERHMKEAATIFVQATGED